MIELLRHFPDWVWLVPGLPLIALSVISARALLGRTTGDAAEPLTARLSALAALGSLLVLLAIDLLAVLDRPPGYRLLAQWFAGSGWQGSFSYLMDELSLSLATLVALIGWLVMRFSANYLHREAGFHRFFIILSFHIQF